MRLSVALAVFNEASNLDACLAAVAGLADEIVIVDGGSTDGTVKIARKFHARILETDNPPVFHINKQKALELCRGEWILQLDADEVVTPVLAEEIKKIINGSQTENGWNIPRKNYFLGRWLKKGGLYPDYVIRLVRRGHAVFPARSVHEQIRVDGRVGNLREPLLHNSYPNLSSYFTKAARYTELAARDLQYAGGSPGPGVAIRYLLVKPAQSFVNQYFRCRGFMDGWRGFLFALFSALHYPVAYFKAVGLKRNVSILLVGLYTLTLLFSASPVMAYSLPYPSYLPGHRLYRFSRIYDQLLSYWYFGPIARVKYQLLIAEKSLVEARTLALYGQYALALDALSRYDKAYRQADLDLRAGTTVGKDMTSVQNVFNEASAEHVRVIRETVIIIPEEFVWSPEDANSRVLKLHEQFLSAGAMTSQERL